MLSRKLLIPVAQLVSSICAIYYVHEPSLNISMLFLAISMLIVLGKD